MAKADTDTAGDRGKPNLENTTTLRTWLVREDTSIADTTLSKSLASNANSYGGYNAANALALVTELHMAQPSDALLVSFLEQADPKTDRETYTALAGRITDPAARAAALVKLAKP